MDKIKKVLFPFSAILIVIGALMYMPYAPIAKYVTSIGVVGYIICLFTTPYPTQSLRAKRLHNMQIFAALLMGVSAFLMFIGNNLWFLTLFIAAILTLYSATMLPKASDESKKK